MDKNQIASAILGALFMLGMFLPAISHKLKKKPTAL